MLIVDTLGRFQVNNGENILCEENIHSDMLVKLMIYVLLNRDRLLSIDELSDVLWQDDAIDNPAGALKNLMYRLRTLLKKYFGEYDFILTARGAYSWNQEIAVVLDVDEFEKMHKTAENHEERSDKRRECYERALDLYQGRFMPGISDMHWVMTISAFYHSLFLSSVKGLAEMFRKFEYFDKMERLISKSLKYDSLDEELYYYQMLSLMYQNKLTLAKEAYDKAVKILNEELGINNSDILKEAHEELLMMNKSKQPEDISEAMEDIQEKEVDGVFLCGYPVFREIYRLQARKAERMGVEEYIVLLTVELPDFVDSDRNHKIYTYRVNHAMEKLEQVLLRSLRIGDVVAKYSDSQYIILLASCSQESAYLVANRIHRLFSDKSKTTQSVKLVNNVEKVTGQNEMLKKAE